MRRRASSTSASVGICHSIVCSSVAERSGSVAGDRERPADPVAEERESFDRPGTTRSIPR
jgi:hypothetical protein